MIKKKIRNSELVISEDGTLYHLNLKAADKISKNILLVGDPARAYQVAQYFDRGITFEQKNREFITLCGNYKMLPITVIGTGIGVDNIEITAVELHVLNEYNHRSGNWNKQWQPLKVIRLGTSGSSQKNIPVGSLAISQYAIGLDNIGSYYLYQSPNKTVNLIQKVLVKSAINKVRPYVSMATPNVVKALIEGCQSINLQLNRNKGFYLGITSSAPGFYAPQGRKIGRLNKVLIPNLQETLEQIKLDDLRIINNEMESSAMFRILGEILNYQVGSICAVLANRNTEEVVSPNEYTDAVDRCIRAGLEAMKRLNQ